MPTNKDFKRLIRRRMQKTGESYTAARTQLLDVPPARTSTSATNGRSNGRASTAAVASDAPPRQRVAKATPAKPAKSFTPPGDYAKLAGMSETAIAKATGCSWKEWVHALDYVEAHTWPHGKIATYVNEKFEISGWWSQCVTVGYERIRGLREIGQRRGGSFEASKSKTVAAPVAALYRAFADGRTRSRWLPGVKLTVRKATPSKSVRMTWPDETSVEVWLLEKGAGKSSVSVQHRKLPDKAAVTKMKEFWGEALERLGTLLSR